LRRVAHARVGTALVTHLQRDLAGSGGRAWQQRVQAAAVGFHRAKIRVGVLFPVRHLQLARLETGAFGGHRGAVPVQVIAVGNLPAQGDALAGGLGGRHEGLVHRQQAGFIDGCGGQGKAEQDQHTGQTGDQRHGG